MEHDSEEAKCVAVKMPVILIRRVDAYRETAGISKNAALVRLIEIGLNSS